MIVFPNCKINLGLFITGKRDDGFHNIESVFIPVPWHDVLEVVASSTSHVEFACSGTPIAGAAEQNIVIKAYHLVRKHFDIPFVKIHLHKTIPTGAGLGGGSSNGTFMIRLLNDMFNCKMPKDLMHDLASQLGSDCPFFLQNTPSFISGRGERIQSIQFDLTGKFIVIVHPGVHISTHEAFSLVKPKVAGFDLRNIASLPTEEWQSRISNDFESSCFTLHPELKGIKSYLIRKGAFYTSLTGSGSSVYGLFHEPVKLSDLPMGMRAWSGVL